MTKCFAFLVVLPLVVQPATGRDTDVLAPAIPAFHSASPALLACLLVTLAALVLAYVGLRRSVTTDERARALQFQLARAREARRQADQALVDNHDVLCRLVRQQEGVRDLERTRIARDLQAELGRRLLNLRHDLARLHDGAQGVQGVPAMAGRLELALANLDAALGTLRAVAGGLRGFGPGDGLRHALERCLAEHAHLYGLRYRFEAGVDPAPRAGHDRAARLAVFRVLQDVLAGAARCRAGGGASSLEDELHVRLREGAGALVLEIDGCAAALCDAEGLAGELLDQIRAVGGILQVVANTPQRTRWSLSVPVGRNMPSAGAAPALATVG